MKFKAMSFFHSIDSVDLKTDNIFLFKNDILYMSKSDIT